MFKKIPTRIENSNLKAIGTAYGLIEKRPFAKFRVRNNFTTFYFTEKEKNSYDEILKTLNLMKK